MSQIVSSGKHSRIYNVQLHKHDEWEFVYCTSGNGTFIFRDYDKVDYEKGDVVSIPPNVYHINNSDIGFTNIFMTVANVNFPFKIPIKIADDANSHIFSAFSEAYYYFNSDINKRELLLASLADLIISYITVYYNQKPFSESVDIIRDDIIKNFTDSSYKIETILNSLNANYDYLRKLFKKEMGQTPLEFLTETRMKLAKRLLSTKEISEYNITEIAEMCGFSDSLYFSRVFKKNTGYSPSEYAAKVPFSEDEPVDINY